MKLLFYIIFTILNPSWANDDMLQLFFIRKNGKYIDFSHIDFIYVNILKWTFKMLIYNFFKFDMKDQVN